MLFSYLIVVVTIILYFFSKPVGFSFIASPWVNTSQVLALVGTVLFSFNYVLSSRFKFLEKSFGGLDKLYRFHHILGAVSFVLIINHPVFLAVNVLPQMTAARNYVFIGNNLSYNFGVLSLYTFIICLALTFLIKLPYNVWYSTHRLLGIPIFLALIHVVLITSDVSRYWPLRFWIILWLILGIGGFLYKLLFYQNESSKYSYTVKKTIRLGNIVEIYLTTSGPKLNYHPGQYLFLTLHQQYLPTESHPFSISSSPYDEDIRLSVKVLGDYTAKLGIIEAGTKASITGPYGFFSEGFYGDKPVICLAGGIGITPFLSMISYETNKPLSRQISLYYCTQSESESVYTPEILRYQSKLPNLNYYPVCTQKEGRLYADQIKAKNSDFKQALFYICGPLKFMESLSAQLQQLGISSNNIIYEDFSFNAS